MITTATLDYTNQIQQAAHAAKMLLAMPGYEMRDLEYVTTVRGVEYNVNYESGNGLGAVERKDEKGRWSTVATFDSFCELCYL